MTDRDEYEADPQGWIKRNTVDGIRPHSPLRPGAEELLMRLYSIPMTPEELRNSLPELFPGYCGPGGNCGTCQICLFKTEER